MSSTKKREDYEIMAPVGSFESLQGAIQGGANAIYFGIEKLNMRAHSAANFTRKDLPEIVSIANANGLKTYLTVNTIVYDNEIEQIKEIIDIAHEHKVDAIIASDQWVIQYANEKGVEVHISTQLNISNYETVKFYAHFADVVVLARELSLEQIKHIHDKIIEDNLRGPKGEIIKIELFVHGALCMSISGKCYLSLHEQNYSANRGSCLQTCRKGYTVTEKEHGHQLDVENEYIMSPKDLCTIHFLNKVLDAGVSVLKIEGRARPAEYVKMVSTCYNEAIEAYISNNYTQEKINDWEKRLSEVFNRGFWGGYYLGKKLGEWSSVYGSQATKKKFYIGKCTNYFTKIKVAEFLLETGNLEANDEILITGSTTGVVQMKAEEIRVDTKITSEAKKGEKFSIAIDTLIRRNDKIYKMVDVKPKVAF